MNKIEMSRLVGRCACAPLASRVRDDILSVGNVWSNVTKTYHLKNVDRKMGSSKCDPVPANVKNSKPYGRVVLTLKNQLLPEDKLSPTPSQLDGLDFESEMDLRIYGCELIQTAGILLKLPQVGSSLVVSKDQFWCSVWVCVCSEAWPGFPVCFILINTCWVIAATLKVISNDWFAVYHH